MSSLLYLLKFEQAWFPPCRLFLDELKVLEHLEAMRRLFFMGAGDFGEALVAALGAHADSLAPLTQHGLERMVQDATRASGAAGTWAWFGWCSGHVGWVPAPAFRLLSIGL